MIAFAGCHANVKPLAIGLAVLASIAAAADARAQAAPPRESPWKAVPVGTVLEFDVVVETSEYMTSKDREKNLKRAESKETWTVLAKDGGAVTIEKQLDGKVTREKLALAAPEPDPVEPTGTGGAHARDGPEWGGRETITTPAGTFDCIVVVRDRTQLESSGETREWRSPKVPVPVKRIDRSAGGVGLIRDEVRTRTLVKFATAASAGASVDAWTEFPAGTVFEIEVEQVITGRSAEPEKKAWTEMWTILEAGPVNVTLEAKTYEGKLVRESFARAAPPPVPGRTGTAEEHEEVLVSKEALTTPLGTFAECVHVTRHRSMIDAGGRREEWHAASYPLPVRTVDDWGAKQTDTRTTRTLVGVKRP